MRQRGHWLDAKRKTKTKKRQIKKIRTVVKEKLNNIEIAKETKLYPRIKMCPLYLILTNP